MKMKIDKTKCKFGFVSKLYEGVGRTGYQMDMLFHNGKQTFDITKDTYDYCDERMYGQYPCLGEYFYMPLFDENGIVTQVVYVNDYWEPDNLFQTGLAIGTYAMFKYQITPETPKTGEFISLDGDTVLFTKLNHYLANGAIKSINYGGIPEPKDGLALKLAPDAVIYTWDWRKSKVPFHRCSKEEAIANDFVTSFDLGVREDILDSYWVTFCSVRGDDSVIDLVKCYKNDVPGWVY